MPNVTNTFTATYADDTAILSPGNDLLQNFDSLQNILNEIENWSCGTQFYISDRLHYWPHINESSWIIAGAIACASLSSTPPPAPGRSKRICASGQHLAPGVVSDNRCPFFLLSKNNSSFLIF